MATISLVIPTHDRPECLARLTEALLAQSRPAKEWIVVNDGATPLDTALLARAEAAGANVRRIRCDRASSAGSRNAGLAAATGDIVLCLDDDMLPDPNLLADLAELYERDTCGVVAGIGLPYEEAAERTVSGRVWKVMFVLLGRVRWRPRRAAARYARLSPALAAELTPATMLPGGAMSLRGEIARVVRFDESFGGYAFGEDRELSYRLGRDWPLFLTRRRRVIHAPSQSGRGDWRQRGRIYAENVLHIVRTSLDAGAGDWLLVGIDFTGAIVQHALWSVATRKRDHLNFAVGLTGALLRHTGWAIGRMLCGR